jgi:serine/threonine protein kinase
MTTPTRLSTPSAERRVGDVLGDKWRLDRVIGTGGMATVYAATHRNNRRCVAIKMLHPELADDEDVRRRFLREGYIANKVGHRGAVAVLDDGVDEEGRVFLVMDLLVGESLGERIERRSERFSEREALFIGGEILDVLAAAHEQGIVHRDLKPDNVFLTADDCVRVLDFGIARLLEPLPGDQRTRTGVMIGTPAYMPPEQARGRSELVDARSDLWATGAILFTLLTGRLVHEGETDNEQLLEAMTEPAPPLASVMPSASAEVAAVIDRALAFAPEDRWPDARAMQQAVREAQRSLDARSGAVAEPPRARARLLLLFAFALLASASAASLGLFGPGVLARAKQAWTRDVKAVTRELPALGASDDGRSDAGAAHRPVPPKGEPAHAARPHR